MTVVVFNFICSKVALLENVMGFARVREQVTRFMDCNLNGSLGLLRIKSVRLTFFEAFTSSTSKVLYPMGGHEPAPCQI